MLTVTDAAASAVNTLLASSESSEGAGLRFERAVDPSGNASLGVAVVSQPEPDDCTVPAGSGAVYLTPDVADLLDDQVLDAETQPEGIAFTIRPQEAIDPTTNGGGPTTS